MVLIAFHSKRKLLQIIDYSWHLIEPNLPCSYDTGIIDHISLYSIYIIHISFGIPGTQCTVKRIDPLSMGREKKLDATMDTDDIAGIFFPVDIFYASVITNGSSNEYFSHSCALCSLMEETSMTYAKGDIWKRMPYSADHSQSNNHNMSIDWKSFICNVCEKSQRDTFIRHMYNTTLIHESCHRYMKDVYDIVSFLGIIIQPSSFYI